MKFTLTGKKWVIVLLHAVCWLILFSLPFLLRTSYKDEHKAPQPDDAAFTVFYFITSVAWIILFYVNAYIFLPFLLGRKKVVRFILLQVLAICIVYFIHRFYF